MTNRIDKVFTQLKKVDKTALIPFLTAGYPDQETFLEILHAMAAHGADLIEIGVPFSDPMADGPVIQHASEQVLKQGMSLKKSLALITEFRRKNQQTPIILMTYANPIEAMGQQVFAQAARQAGVDGCITVDYPLEEIEDFVKILKNEEIDPILLLAPTSTDERIFKTAEMAAGFIYYVSLAGVTGSKRLDIQQVAQSVRRLKQMQSLPVAVGFGVHDAQSARELSKFADAVIMGTKIIETINESMIKEQVHNVVGLIQQMRDALDNHELGELR